MPRGSRAPTLRPSFPPLKRPESCHPFAALRAGPERARGPRASEGSGAQDDRLARSAKQKKEHKSRRATLPGFPWRNEIGYAEISHVSGKVIRWLSRVNTTLRTP